MRAIILTGLVTLLCAPAFGASLPEPIAKASSGQVLCYAPDAARKTCKQIDLYISKPDGTIFNPSLVLIDDDPLVVMGVSQTVTVKKGQVCAPMRKQDLDAATYTVEGAAASDEQTAKLRAVLVTTYNAYLGKEFCMELKPDGDALDLAVSVDGVHKADFDDKANWVPADAGYTVAP